MNGTATKKTKRDLRRAVGASAVDVIDRHEQGLKAHALSLQRHEQLFEVQKQAREALKRDYGQTLEVHHARISTLDRELRVELGEVRNMLARDLWGRLRWLLTGR